MFAGCRHSVFVPQAKHFLSVSNSNFFFPQPSLSTNWVTRRRARGVVNICGVCLLEQVVLEGGTWRSDWLETQRFLVNN